MRAFVAVILVAIVLLAMGHFAEAIGVTAFLALLCGGLLMLFFILVLDAAARRIRLRRLF